MTLIMDNFGAHINPEVLQLLVDNHVIIVPLPPHARVHFLTRKKPVGALAKDATACSKAMESATVCWASCLPLEAAVIATSAHVISAWQIAAAMAPAHGTNLAGTGDGSATGGLPPP
mmetsp:Transcript_11718/g.29498  ORF Transcript_11718/g.29498 Transcript_11718/m.29498 type:complete len:117 (-) Transcript_11718:116-466(-)